MLAPSAVSVIYQFSFPQASVIKIYLVAKFHRNADKMQQVKLVSSDNVSCTVASEIAKKCMKTVKKWLDDSGNLEPEDEIPVPVVSGEILKKIIDWAIYHNGEPPFYQELKDISEWDKKFLEVDDDILFDIIEAAKYLEMPGLLQLCYVHT